jgi:hypothetical protein
VTQLEFLIQEVADLKEQRRLLTEENRRYRKEMDKINAGIPSEWAYSILKKERESLQEENDKLKAQNWILNDRSLRTYDGMAMKADRYDELLIQAEKLVLALVFISMPITTENRTLSAILETVENDTNRAKKALEEWTQYSENLI